MDWAAVAATATLFAAVIALGLGVRQFSHLSSIKEHEARIVAASIYPVLLKISGVLECCRDGTYPGPQDSDAWKIAICGLWSIQRISIQEVILYANKDPVGGSVLAETINLLVLTIESQGLPKAYDGTYNYDLFLLRMKSDGLRESFDVIQHNLAALYTKMMAMRYRSEI